MSARGSLHEAKVWPGSSLHGVNVQARRLPIALKKFPLLPGGWGRRWQWEVGNGRWLQGVAGGGEWCGKEEG